jgi:zinc protease
MKTLKTILTGCIAAAIALVPYSVAAQTTPPPAGRGQATPPRAAAPVPQQAPAQLVAQMPAPAPPKPYHFPAVATKTLANGMRVFVVTSPEMPAVSARLLLVSAGSVNDPEGKPGVAAMTANMLTQGTVNRTAQQIAESIDFVGGSLSASAGDDGTAISVTVVKKDFDLAMDLLSDVAMHANFRAEDLARQQAQLLSNMKINYDDADYLATAVFHRVVFGMHPYGIPSEGTPGSIALMAREDLLHFRDATYAPSTALLAFAGDITPEAAFAAAEKYFGAWSNRAAPMPTRPAPGAGAGVHVFVLNKPDAVQTQIRVGRLGVRRNDPDFIPLYVVDRIFGGSYNSRLNTEVRIKKGLTYGANSDFESRLEGGSMMAATFTRTEATMDALRLVVGLFKDMANGNVKPEELSFARDYLVGVYPIQTETPDQVASHVLTVAHYGLPADLNETYTSRVAAVTLAQANAMATKYFQSATLDVVLVGNASQFRDALKKEFPGASYIEVPPGQLDLMTPELYHKPDPLPPATPESLAQGRSLLLSALQSAGGMPALSKILSFEFSATDMMAVATGDTPVQRKLYVVYPDRFRLDTKIPMAGGTLATVVLGFDGTTGWASSPNGTIAVPPDQNVEFLRGILLTGAWGLYRAAQAGTLQAQSLGQRDFLGQKVDAIAVTMGEVQLVFYVDSATHLPFGASFSQDTPQGRVETTQVWSDYRDVQGMKFPFHNVTSRNGQKFYEETVEEVKVNTNPNLSIFVKPQ